MSSTSSADAARDLLERVLGELGAASGATTDHPAPPHPVPLPSRLATGDLAWASVGAVCVVAGIRTVPDPDRVALVYRSDRLLMIGGEAPSVWSPLSGFWRTRDGWVRTHGNYPHHAEGLLRGLGIRVADRMLEAMAERTSAEAVAAITGAGGLAVAVASEVPARDAALRRGPLLDVRRTDASSSRGIRSAPDALPLTGVRILDLTRVIAGPVCTRTLALLGADVLRIDPPHLPEPVWQHDDTGHGKRTALLDARSAVMPDLLSAADVVVLGYRPSSLETLGLSPDLLAARHPGLVIAELSAWGAEHPDRAGFDSLVQAESGIAVVESPDGERPGALPAQALDHSAGYLLAASVVALLERRRLEGGTWQVRTSLRRIAAELLGMPRREHPEPERTIDPAPHTAVFDVGGRTVTTARPALPGLEFAAPRPWGGDQPRW
ncbi:CoA transferase [Microbacterium hydrocarbonoxydans]|uniref:CoA transferase n=1 Tax=Microbacterium hydrocarbonoxydans TaxID=273678 RepID=UPI0007BBC48F|nr:CoA transferase [Microbacterium hydrocarbonoxydans]GAT74781.1 L-carnitine dehydratase/bile acid-inducible protein [Microbacterium sp. HM58-2]